MSAINFEVRRITRNECAPFILEIHYAKRWPSISYAFGLFEDDELIGVVTYGTPASRHLQKSAAPTAPKDVIELNRLCLKYNRKNEASFLISRALKLLPPKIVVSYADTAHGHFGGVYRAANFFYAGWTDMDRKTPRFDYVCKNGTHSRNAFRNGDGINSERVERKPKIKYWTVTGSKSQKKKLMKKCGWIKTSWLNYPPPFAHVFLKIKD
jgi:hypothetical protein